jgi:hypothetical protein
MNASAFATWTSAETIVSLKQPVPLQATRQGFVTLMSDDYRTDNKDADAKEATRLDLLKMKYEKAADRYEDIYRALWL